MSEHWQALIINFAVVALFISLWVNGQFVFAGRPRVWRNAALGLTMGLGTVASMLLGIEVDGSLFDLRWSLLAIAGFFGGPVAGAVAASIAVAYRVGFVGGPSALLAVNGIIVAALTGIVASSLTRDRTRGLFGAAFLALCVPAVSLALGAVIRTLTMQGFAPLSFSVAMMNMGATAISAFFILHYQGLERERDLFRAALTQSPDFQYVKTTDFRFVTANMAVARLNGFDSPAKLVGKTDFDIAPPAHAEALMATEREIIASGKALIDFEETMIGPAGDEVWYLTSKVPLHDADGAIVGVAGVTRDITAQKQLRQDLTDSRNQLNYVLSEISDGIAMYDSQGTLAYCNDQFSNIFPLTAAVRRRGQHIRDILRAVVETREQKGIPQGEEERWIDEVAHSLTVPGGREIELHDGRWLSIRTRPTGDGRSLVVVSDVTSAKLAQAALLSMTEQLKLLATTDALTGLNNRRAFDQAVDGEMARSRRSGAPLSVLMIDVDRFKSYNDLYGHLAGDEALKRVGQCLKAALKRPSDVAARYGGEEFVAILPDTDEDGAFFIADAFRESLRGHAMPHKGSDKGVLTASVGIAVLHEGEPIGPEELLRRADEALYNAKDAGRDRVMGWRVRAEIGKVAGLRAGE